MFTITRSQPRLSTKAVESTITMNDRGLHFNCNLARQPSLVVWTTPLAAGSLLMVILALACGGRPSPDNPNGQEDNGTPPTHDPVEECVMANDDSATTGATLEDALGRATLTVDDPLSCKRTYTLGTTQTLRHDLPDNPRVIEERSDGPLLRSGNLLVDALYALTLEEVRECSVDAIRDGAFNHGEEVGCGEGGCFETGRLWNYVWTRDTAYAVDLGLAGIDPVRARNSLDFKLSERRSGGDLQIVQDTGSGGSYPVSSDRVSWAVGALELYRQLHGDERAAFAGRAYEAIRNTLEHDRKVVYDPEDGLYRGEQSFLDWREQSYPSWTADDVVHIAMSKALSTNLLHMRAMEVAAIFGRKNGDESGSARYAGWALELRTAIRERLWLPEDGLFSAFVTTGLDPAPARQADLLGSAFAVLFGVADEEQADSILARYPHYGPGAPVIWPQQQLTPVYHNRGEWPFVTAYWLRAAAARDNDSVADRMVRALIRGTALNLSNMENFEAATGSPWLEDGPYSGPVVNSQRQLWSVAAFLSLVHHTIFGLRAENDGLRVQPFVTRGIRNDLLSETDRVVLNRFPYAGELLTVVIHLPAIGGEGGSYSLGEVRLNGEVVPSGLLSSSMLGDENHIDVFLIDEGDRPPSAIEVRDPARWREIFGPRPPRIESAESTDGRVRVSLSVDEGESGDVTLSIYRDGMRVVSGLRGDVGEWEDRDVSPATAASACYTVEACFRESGNCSQRARPLCWWRGDSVQEHGAETFENEGGSPTHQYGRYHFEGWGDPGHRLLLPSFVAERGGKHLVQLVFGNGAGPIATGITCSVKQMVVEDTETGEEAGRGLAVMPHLGTWERWADSSFVIVDLVEGRTYRVIIGDGDGAENMSVFQHFSSYTAGLGGSDGPFNRVNIAAVKVLSRQEP